ELFFEGTSGRSNIPAQNLRTSADDRAAPVCCRAVRSACALIRRELRSDRERRGECAAAPCGRYQDRRAVARSTFSRGAKGRQLCACASPTQPQTLIDVSRWERC